MNVLKTPSFFRPASRPSSPAPIPALPLRSETPVNSGSDRAARPLNKFALGNLRRASPVPSARSTPTPLVQDGSYLEMLSLKFSEAVSKALAQPSGPALPHELVSGKRPLPQGRGHALGALIASELLASQNNLHLYRAILRSLHRPLSVLLTNLSGHLLPLLASPHFHSPPTPIAQSPSPNPTQVHALANATFAQELLETFDELGLGLDADVRGDGLKSIREGLVSVIHRVVNPLIGSMRSELIPLIEALENVNDSHVKSLPGVKPSMVYHPSIVSLRTIMPAYAKVLARYTASPTTHTVLATFLIAVVWKGLVALSHRPFVTSAPPSPVLVSNKKARTPSPYNTPPVTPPLGRFTLKLPPSRPPSPPTIAIPASASADAQALFDLLNTLPRPNACIEATRLAREAVDEAFDALKALSALLDAIHKKNSDGRSPRDMAKEINVLAEDIPVLIALPILLHAYGGSKSGSVANLLGLSESEYRKGCLGGIGRAEECASLVAQRVMDALQVQGDADGIIYQWLRLETIAN
ncbi:hypothetical protein AN958_04650 [Leucoagaricus sp. SymC.cos]|nr:hypothetical protein AN958_04650 [Leucoagaricus sp. SymC.cos]